MVWVWVGKCKRSGERGGSCKRVETARKKARRVMERERKAALYTHRRSVCVEEAAPICSRGGVSLEHPGAAHPTRVRTEILSLCRGERETESQSTTSVRVCDTNTKAAPTLAPSSLTNVRPTTHVRPMADPTSPPVAPNPRPPPLDWPSIAPAATRVAALAVVALALASQAWGTVVVATLVAAVAPSLVRTAALMCALAWLPGPEPSTLAEHLLGCVAAMQPPENYIFTVVFPWAQRYGPLFRIRALWRPLVVVTDPAVATWTLSRGAGLEKSTSVYHGINLMSDPHGAPTLLSQATASEVWKATRKAVAPAFSAGALKARFPAIMAAAGAAADAVAPAARTGALVDVDALLAAESCDVVASAGFGVDVGAVGEAAAAICGAPPPPPTIPGVTAIVRQLHAATKQAEQYVVEPWRAWRVASALLPHVREGERELASFRGTLDRVLAAAATVAAARGGPDPASIYGRLVAAAGSDAAALRREAGLLLFAAVDTSSHTSAHTLALLAAHPEAGARVTAELATAGLLATPSKPRPLLASPSDAAASRLPYLHACIKESMRLLPVAGGGTGRLVGRGGARVGGGHVPEGTQLWVPFFVLHRLPSVWGDDAVDFRPERWLDVDADAPAAGPDTARRYLPFSAGARSCVGQALAEVNIAAALVTLWGRYAFELPPRGVRMGDDTTPLPFDLASILEDTTMAVTVQPVRGVWLKARSRVETREE